MTISSSTTRELTIGQLVKRAYNLAGLLNPAQDPNSSQKQAARDYLDLLLDEIAAEGVQAREVTFYDLAITAGLATYALPITVGEPLGMAAYLPDGTNAAGTPILRISADEWNRVQMRSSSGTPTFYYPDMSAAPVVVHLWMTPSADATIRFRVQRKLADSNNDADTLDLDQFWHTYVLWELAHMLSVSASQPKGSCAYLAGVAEKKKQQAKANSGTGTSIQTQVKSW